MYQIWLVRVCYIRILWPFDIPLLPVPTTCQRLTLYFLWMKSDIIYFSEKILPYLFIQRQQWYLETKIWLLAMLTAAGVSLSLG